METTDRERVCYVVGAAPESGPQPKPLPGDLLIAADGGLRYCRTWGLTPDLVVGDLDSLQEPAQSIPNLVRLPRAKDDTDTLHALRLGLTRGYRVFSLHGNTGGRMDLTLANLQSLTFLVRHGARGVLRGDAYTATVIQDEALAFGPETTGTVSVFAWGGPAEGVTETGLRYALTDATLTPDFPLGVSNAFTGRPAVIRVRKGMLLILCL